VDGTWVDGEELLREDAGRDQLVVKRVVAHGRPMVDIRRHYDTDTNGGGDPVYAPGRKGVLISEELAARVGEALGRLSG
jgi:Transcriptional Coactivator p15 (PC4)